MPADAAGDAAEQGQTLEGSGKVGNIVLDLGLAGDGVPFKMAHGVPLSSFGNVLLEQTLGLACNESLMSSCRY